VAHALGHAVLTIYFCGLVSRSGWYKVCGFMISFGIAVEIAQYFMDVGREADRYDILANTLGMVAGLTLAHFGMNRWPRWAAWMLGQRTAA
jgi:glycopeptide antibiotics resistance protein